LADALLASFPRVGGGLRSAKCRGLLEHWRTLCVRAGGGLPSRTLLDPLNIAPALLPHLFLCEYREGGGVLIRLQGTYLADQAGQTMTGLCIDASTFGEAAPVVLRLYEAIRRARRPIASHEQVLTSHGYTISCEVMHLPLLREDGRVGYVLGALDRIDTVVNNKGRFAARAWDAIQIVEGEALS
jgi:hypothetical protein